MTKDETERALRLKRLAPAGEDRAGAAGLRPALCVARLNRRCSGAERAGVDEGRRAIAAPRRWKKIVTTAAASFSKFPPLLQRGRATRSLLCQQLEAGLRAPVASFMLSRRLETVPVWDPLRGDPRFEKIVASLAPKK